MLIDYYWSMKGIRGEICHAVHWYTETKNKYMEGYDPSTEFSYLTYWDVNSLYGSVISQKLAVGGW